MAQAPDLLPGCPIHDPTRALLPEHAARDFDPLAGDPAILIRQQRGDDAPESGIDGIWRDQFDGRFALPTAISQNHINTPARNP